ncbi:MAG: flavin reductase family protein, partial [Sulfitobacter sp.]|nr:flavin reductase family protein [Sulfitobacter sp.]
ILIVCVNRKIPACDLMAEAGAFSVNFLTDDQSDIARRFSQEGCEGDPFAAGKWSSNGSGAPILHEAASSFECDVERLEQLGGHCVFFGAITAVHCSDGTGLLYRDGFFRRLAIE